MEDAHRPLVGIAIQAHPSRRTNAEQLAAALNADVAWSVAPHDVWATHVRAREIARGARWNLVVQDDAILGHDFIDRLYAVLESCDHELVSLFYRDKARRNYSTMIDAAAAGRPLGGFSWPLIPFGIATAIRDDLVPDMLAFGHAFKERPDRDDPRVRAWALARGHLIWYPLPSLVDHDAQGTSLVGHGTNAGRTARWFE